MTLIMIPMDTGPDEPHNMVGERTAVKREPFSALQVRITYEQYNSALGKMDQYTELENTWLGNLLMVLIIVIGVTILRVGLDWMANGRPGYLSRNDGGSYSSIIVNNNGVKIQKRRNGEREYISTSPGIKQSNR